jgi:nitric oxide reductase subunit B
MNKSSFRMLRFALILLITALCVGVVAAFIFFDLGTFNQYLPFYKLRPLHVSASVFWIFSAAQGGLYIYSNDYFKPEKENRFLINTSSTIWIVTTILILASFVFGSFGGREYWEFPPVFAIPILISWMLFAIHFFKMLFKKGGKFPVYVWMWSTGIIFFLLTYTEANLWMIPWFRENIIRDITIQWKANGAIVGSWNQLVYGTAFYLMVKISGDDTVGFKWQSFFFYFLGLTNLIFNWGHHIYNLPGANWVRTISYVISMTEWIILINIMQSFKAKLSEAKKFANIIPYRFLLASEIWIFLNLFLAILMSIPAVNIYTHGTHVTVAHAMGATIGINTMILFASIFYIFTKHNDTFIQKNRIVITTSLWVGNISLLVFWFALIVAGIVKGYYMVTEQVSFEVAMQHVRPFLWVFAVSGIFVAASLTFLAAVLLRTKRQ